MSKDKKDEKKTIKVPVEDAPETAKVEETKDEAACGCKADGEGTAEACGCDAATDKGEGDACSCGCDDKPANGDTCGCGCGCGETPTEDKPSDPVADTVDQVKDVAHGTAENIGKVAAVVKESVVTAAKDATTDVDVEKTKEQVKALGDNAVELGKTGLGVAKGFFASLVKAYKENSAKVKGE